MLSGRNGQIWLYIRCENLKNEISPFATSCSQWTQWNHCRRVSQRIFIHIGLQTWYPWWSTCSLSIEDFINKEQCTAIYDTVNLIVEKQQKILIQRGAVPRGADDGTGERDKSAAAAGVRELCSAKVEKAWAQATIKEEMQHAKKKKLIMSWMQSDKKNEEEWNQKSKKSCAASSNEDEYAEKLSLRKVKSWLSSAVSFSKCTAASNKW